MNDPNPLAIHKGAPRQQNTDPMLMHARMWQHVGQMAPNKLQQTSDRTAYALPILGALAGNPDVTAKDVIKAAAQAAADGKVSPSEAVGLISQMPDDPAKVQGWLKGMYAANLSMQVHLKAALMQQAQGAPQGPQQPGPGQPAPQANPVTPTSMTPGVAL